MIRRFPICGLLSGFALASISLIGCGSDPGQFNGGGDPGLAFDAIWVGADDNEIPQFVETVRVRLDSGDNDFKCCIAIPRESDTFEQRSVTISPLDPGEFDLEITAFGNEGARLDREEQVCPTLANDAQLQSCRDNDPSSGQEECLSEIWPPSYKSDLESFLVRAGETTQASVNIRPLPFVLDERQDSQLKPIPCETVSKSTIDFQLRVVTAAEDSADKISLDSIKVFTESGDVPVRTELTDLITEACNDDRSGSEPACANPTLGVSGFVIEGVSGPLPNGPAWLIVTAGTQRSGRDMQLSLPVTVESTTQLWTLTYSVSSPVALGALEYETDYSGAQGEFLSGPNGDVDCKDLLPSETTLAVFNDDAGGRTLSTAVVSTGAFGGPDAGESINIAECRFETSLNDAPPNPSDFEIINDRGFDIDDNEISNPAPEITISIESAVQE